MTRHPLAATAARRARLALPSALIWLFTASMMVVPACATQLVGAQAAAALDKGLIDVRLEQTGDAAEQATIVREAGTTLKARWVRLLVDWSALEADRGTYSPSAVTHLDALVDELRAENVKVILTTYKVPKWAQDASWWKHPPSGFPTGPQPFYAIRSGALDDYSRLAEFLAVHFAGRVRALECWNEPNLWSYIYPQRTASDANFGARTYLSMLRAFHQGVARAHAHVQVIAGATAPLGTNDRYATSPQQFARYLQTHHAASLFDVYSHHPYTPGGTVRPAPDQPPNNPATTVTLYNLSTLLDLFPGKPFYLTEYGYNTQPSIYFGEFSVSPQVQARYLTTAYAYARRYKRVKVMLWYLLYDWRPSGGAADTGVYTGLRTADGKRKPAWYAYQQVP